MKIGIIGLPQTGKKTLFHILTGTEHRDEGEGNKALLGIADIRDPRFDALVQMYAPKKTTPAKIDVALLPRLERESIAQGDVFKDIVDMDAICHVVRAFDDESVYHVDGSVNPGRDIAMVNGELILHDLLFIEKRLERIESNLKKLKDEKQQRELALLEKMKAHLEDESPLRLLPLAVEEDLLIRSYPFITRKSMILALNVSDDAANRQALQQETARRFHGEGVEVMQVPARMEAEIADLETEEERQEFLREMGIAEPALAVLTGLCIRALGLISFFTVGKDEVRQWLIRRGTPAREAAGTIHSDLQRGFIRAEVMKYADLAELRSEAGVKQAGKLYLKGRDYVVEDGDIFHVRFKV